MENFELIQMMNETNPNLISDDAMLVISASHSSVESSYAHLLQKIQRSSQANRNFPFYLLRKAKSLLIQNSKCIKQEVDEIVQVLQYFTETLMIKRLTILSFEEGSLLTLRALAFIKYDVFSIIDKFILVNPFNPTIVILHSNPAFFLDETKQLILADPVRTQLTNDTRIIIIHTIDNDAGDQKINWLFKNTNGQRVTFANSLVVQSKLMWNVYSYLKPEEYFRFQPFIQILTKLFNEDRENWPLPIKDINYLLLYRETPQPKQLNIDKRNKILSKCVDYYAENYNIDGTYMNSDCVRILRKEDFYFNENTTLIMRSLGKFQVYGENYEKITPYDTKDKQTIYLLQNMQEYRRIFIINTRRFSVHILIQPVLRPQIVKSEWMSTMIPDNDFNQFYFHFKTVFHKNTSQPVLLCPGHTVLYPSSLVPMLYDAYFHLSSQFYLQKQVDCYIGLDSYIILLRNLMKYWSLGFNLIIFSLFCFHVVKRGTFSRFYYQLLINYTLTFIHTGQSLFSQNLVILSIVVLIQQCLRLATFMSDMIYMPKKLAVKVMWLPLVFEILRWMKANIFFSPWKAIGLIFFAGTRKSNIVILFLKFTFIMEYIVRDISNPQSLFLCCAWLANSSLEELSLQPKPMPEGTDILILTTGRKLQSIKQTIITLRKQIVDTFTICIIAMCLSEDGVVLHYIINFYIVAFIIFAIHQQINDWN